MAQFFQQLLTISPFTQIEIAQDEVVMFAFDLEDGLCGIRHQLHLGHADIGQGQPQRAADAGVIVHHQRTQSSIVDFFIAALDKGQAHACASLDEEVFQITAISLHSIQ